MSLATPITVLKPCPPGFAAADPLADRILAGKRDRGEARADDHYPRASTRSASVKCAPSHRHTHRREEIGGDHAEHAVDEIGGTGSRPSEPDVGPAASTMAAYDEIDAESHLDGRRGFADTPQRLNDPRRLGELVVGSVTRAVSTPRGSKPMPVCWSAMALRNQEAGSHEQRERQRHLGDDQRATEAIAQAACRSSAAVRAMRRQVVPRRA